MLFLSSSSFFAFEADCLVTCRMSRSNHNVELICSLYQFSDLLLSLVNYLFLVFYKGFQWDWNALFYVVNTVFMALLFIVIFCAELVGVTLGLVWNFYSIKTICFVALRQVRANLNLIFIWLAVVFTYNYFVKSLPARRTVRSPTPLGDRH
jgi:hypothetical protein